jgi:hypothetical protein
MYDAQPKVETVKPAAQKRRKQVKRPYGYFVISEVPGVEGTKRIDNYENKQSMSVALTSDHFKGRGIQVIRGYEMAVTPRGFTIN